MPLPENDLRYQHRRCMLSFYPEWILGPIKTQPQSYRTFKWKSNESKKRNLSLARLWCEQQRIRVAFWEWKIVMVPWWKFGSWFVGNTRKYDGHTRIYTGQIFFISCSYDGKLALLLLDPCWTFAISLISCRTNVQRPALFTGLLLNNPVGYFVWPKLW